MKKLFLFFLVAVVFSVHSQNLEQKYKVSENSPEWIKEMYSKLPNLKKVKEEYEKYYKSHEFIKNQHTQYYKRWLRENEPLVDNEGNIVLPTTEKLIKQRSDYNKQLLAKKTLESNGVANWEEIGPWEYDHAAAMALTTQSPGSAHIYTVEQAPSNSNTIYAGTATAGVWKSTDKGVSWNIITKDLLVDTVQALAIDPTNENIVYFGYDNKIWKTIDGGLTWNIMGGDIGYARDIKIKATNNNEILAATTWGLYRSIDAGTTWNELISGYMYEIEFHPTDPNIVYAIKSENNRTEFLKSIDGGASFSPRYTGWPGVGAVANTNFKALDLDSSSYATTTNEINLGSVTIPNFTIEMKLKSNGWGYDPSIFSNKDWSIGSNKGFVVYGTYNGGIGFNIGDGTNRVDLGGGSIDDNQWHHVSITYDSIGDKKIYVDGVEVDSSTDNITTDVLSGLSTAFYQDGTLTYGASFAGKIGEVRVFNTVLDATTINDNYCLMLDNTHPNYADLIHHFALEEGIGDILIDGIQGNNGTITGVGTWDNANLMSCVISSFALQDEQKRTEISVSESDPNLVLALAVGDVNGGSGLVGIYKSIDAGETFNFICCGNGPGGLASATNKNIVGYSGDLDENGGQYYYDLAMDISPTDANKVFGGGIMVVKSTDGGVNWVRNNHWVTWADTPADREKYVHADVHDIKFFKNGSNTDLWVATDGGLYYSADQGETMEPRMHGIQGTEFWGFGSSSIGDAMIGGTYHNGTLWHYENLYLKGKNGHGGWIAQGAGDASDGYIHEANPKWFFDYGGLAEFPDDRLSDEQRRPFDGTKVASFDTHSYSNYEWLPNQYNEYYSAANEKLWKTNNNGTAWELVHDFSEGKIYDTRTSQANPNVIYVIHQTDARKYVKKSIDKGQNWTDITPPDALVDAWYNNNRSKNLDISHTNENHIWCIINGDHSTPKVLQSFDGGINWTNITGSLLTNQDVISIAHQQGTDGGIYVGTSKAVYYKNNTMSDFVLYNQGLPAITRVQFQYPNYTYQKLRIGTYRGAFQGDFYEASQPIAKPSVDKIKSYCVRDELNFKDLSFASSVGHSRQWNFPGGTPSSSTDENPVVSYAAPGNYTVSLTVTDVNGTDTTILTDFISIVNECEAEEVPGNALILTQGNNAAAVTSKSIDFGATTDFSASCWIKTNSTVVDGVILSDKDWGTGKNKGWVLAMASGRILFNIGDGSNRVDLSTGTETFNDNKWYYVTVTADRDGLASLYIDGTLKESANMNSIGNIFIDQPIFMGVDNELNYPFDGLIDEVKIWNTAISQNYLREQRHLTAVPANDPNLIAYYQFNRIDNQIIDRAGTYHANYINTAANVTSSAPIGGGKSEKLIINSSGAHAFSNADLELTLPNSSTYPNGEVVASKIHVSPNMYPNDGTPLDYYWILNNYGANTDFTVSSILFKNLDSISLDQVANPSRFNLFKRDENEDNDWGTSIDEGDSAVISGIQGNVTFSTGLNLTNTGQFIITDNTSTLTVDENELNLNNDLLIYPTIASNSNTITIENNSNKKLDLTIYNLLGQKIKQLDNIGEIQLIKVNHLKSGVYLLKFISEDNIEASKRLIIN